MVGNGMQGRIIEGTRCVRFVPQAYAPAQPERHQVPDPQRPAPAGPRDPPAPPATVLGVATLLDA